MPGLFDSAPSITPRLELQTIHGLTLRIGNGSVPAERRTCITAPAAGVARVAAAAAAGRTATIIHAAEGRHPALGVLQHDTVVVVDGGARVERSLGLCWAFAGGC